MAEHLYAQGQGQPGAQDQGQTGSSNTGNQDNKTDDVVDAEFEEVKEDKKE